MRVLALILVVLSILKSSNGALWSNCHIEGIQDYDWISTFRLPEKINDTHEGAIANFTTKNITALISTKAIFLNATFENEVLTIFTNEHFKNIEKEMRGQYNKWISIRLNFKCNDTEEDTMEIYQEIEDINNHDPVFSQSIYEYSLGMTIPEEFDMSSLLPIYATDYDFTNWNVYFTIEWNDEFKLGFVGEEYKGNYSTSLTSLKAIKAPYRREFILTATDEGETVRNTTAKLIVSVTSVSGDNNNLNSTTSDNTTVIHPPVFSEHLYFANYTVKDQLNLKEKPFIKYGLQNDTLIEQSDYQEYFKLSFNSINKGEIDVTLLKQLPETLLEKDLLVIELEATNPGLKIPGRTALIINLSFNQTSYCNIYHIFGYSLDTSLLPIVFSISSLCIIVLLNVVILSLYFAKQNNNSKSNTKNSC